MPDVFMAGYEGVWLPPPTKGQAGTNDIGYALFDRFDLGSTAAPTRYGTEAGFRLLIDEYHRANAQVFVDWIMNHNGSMDNNTPGFVAQGDYPGFVLEIPGTDPDGDFHDYSNGCPQSTNPNDLCYDLFRGRLVGLIDIDQSKNHRFIRHPTTMGDPDNIPAGTLYDRPEPGNTRFYSDLGLPGVLVTNPGTSRNPGGQNFFIHPFNTGDPAAGDPVLENATQLLLRATQWMLDDVGVDGFRLDAAKHISTDFWDRLWDTWVHMRHADFDGAVDTPYSFVEVVGDNNLTADYVRRTGEPGSGTGWPPLGWEFGNRDALDLNEAGALRDLSSAQGFGNWGTIIGSSVDNRDDGFNNGTIGVHHVTSHDNAISETISDNVSQAYVLLRTGGAIVYHNALQFGPSGVNFPRNNSRGDALGLGSDAITVLTRIRNEYARGWFVPLNHTDPVNQSMDDVLVFVRRTPPAGPDPAIDNVLVALNDRYDSGFQIRSIATEFPPGTRLHELTGNAANSTVDPNGNIPEVLVTDANRRVTLHIPNNRNVNGVRHDRGYVVYGPAAPSGTLTFTNVSSTIPPDDPSTPAHRRRLTPVTVIRSDAFEIRLQTTQTDPLDPNTDDLAVFRIDSGFADRNGNGVIDRPTGDLAGYESFLTLNSPRFGGGSGTYRQLIDATGLPDGMHYICVKARRHRTTGMPIYRDLRAVVMLDRLPPQVTLVSPTQTGNGDILASTFLAIVEVDDPNVTSVHMFLDRHVSEDLVSAAQAGQGIAQRLDPTTYRVAFNGAIRGNHRIDVVVFDSAGTPSVTPFVGINALTPFFGGLGDVDNNFAINGADIAPFVDLVAGSNAIFHPAADFNGDGLNDAADVTPMVARVLTGP